MKKIVVIALLLSSISYSQTLIKTYYDPFYKTKLKEIYQVKKNTPIANGYYKLYDEYGFILEHKNYLNNKLNGKSIKFIGAYQASITYGGKKNIGEVFIISNYKNNTLNGTELRYNFTKEGKKYLQFKKTFEKDILVKHIEYFSNNQEKKNLQIGKCYEYYKNGNKYAEYTADENGYRQGKYTKWSDVKKIELIGRFLNDKKNGEWIEYNNDGSVKNKKKYILGKRQKTEKEKLEEKNRQIFEKKKLEEKEFLEKKKDEEEKRKKEKKRIKIQNYRKLKILEDELYFEESNLKSNYKYWDEDKYKYHKGTLYNKYIIVMKFLKEDLKTKIVSDQILYLKLCVRLTKKMNELIGVNTRKLESKIYKINDVEVLIDLIIKN